MKILFVCTFNPDRSEMGGGAWVNRRLVSALSEDHDVTVLSLTEPPNTQRTIPLEIRKSAVGSFATLVRMALLREPYQEAKFKWSPLWSKSVTHFREEAAVHDLIVTSEWPALLAAQQLGLAPDIHVAFNVDTVLAERFDPLLFRLLNNSSRMAKREQELLGWPNEIFALSAADVVRIRRWGVFPHHLRIAYTFKARHQVLRRSVGFIGKMSWPPNAHAVEHLVSRIAPKLNDGVSSVEHIRVVLAGRGSENYAAWPDVSALGMVAEIDQFYNEIDMTVVPREGETTGISVKMLEALERGVQVVVPSALAYDAGASQGVLIGDTDEEVIARIREFYANPPGSTAADPDARSRKSESSASATHISELSSHAQRLLESRENLLGLTLTFADAAKKTINTLEQLMDACLSPQGPMAIVTLNLQHVYLARKYPSFRRVINSSDAVTADGWPTVQLLRAWGSDVIRTTGSDFVRQLVEDQRIQVNRLALIGGSEETGARFAELLAERGGHLVFREHGDKGSWEPSLIAAQLNQLNVSLLLTAVSLPYGDSLGAALVDAGFTGTVIGVGGGLEMLVGSEHRAPRVVQSLRTEWLFRLLQNPGRLWRRYLLEGIPTYYAVILPLSMRRRRTPR